MATLQLPSPTPINLRDMRFKEAAPLWLESRRAYVRKRTHANVAAHISKLTAHFADFRLSAIRANDLRNYQQRRALSSGPSYINHEVSTLAQILKRAGTWEKIAADYQPLPLPKWIPPRVLTESDKEHFFQTCQSDSRLEIVFHVLRMTANTTVPFGELRGCRLADIHLDKTPPTLYVPDETVKNEFRARPVPLNPEALESLQWLIARANKRGAQRPEHYLFPFRACRNHYDPNRPASGTMLRNKFRDAVILSGLDNVRCYNFRHQAITELLEKPGVSEETIKAIAGHVSPRILQTYSHVRIEAKHAALTLLSKSAPAPGSRAEHIDRIMEAGKALGMKPEKILRIIAQQELKGGQQ